MENYEKYWAHAVVAIVALIIGFMVGAYWKSSHISDQYQLPSDLLDTGSTTVDSLFPTSTSTSNSTLQVSNQKAGSQVIVDSILIGAPSWVVISDDESGAPGWILGAQEFVRGMATGTVDLLRATVSGKTYHAIIYSDNGDNMFDFKVDAPISGPDGKNVDSVFITS